MLLLAIEPTVTWTHRHGNRCLSWCLALPCPSLVSLVMVWWGEDSRFASSVLPSFLQGVGTIPVTLVTQGYPPLIDSTIADMATGDLPSAHQHINKTLFIVISWGSLADQGDKNFVYMIDLFEFILHCKFSLTVLHSFSSVLQLPFEIITFQKIW
jgi:hypothetical protein